MHGALEREEEEGKGREYHIMTPKEIAALDKKIEKLKPKLHKADAEYNALAEQMSALLEQRYPERKEEAVKQRLYDAYKKSGKTLDLIIDFIENAPDDDFWN